MNFALHAWRYVYFFLITVFIKKIIVRDKKKKPNKRKYVSTLIYLFGIQISTTGNLS